MNMTIPHLKSHGAARCGTGGNLLHRTTALRSYIPPLGGNRGAEVWVADQVTSQVVGVNLKPHGTSISVFQQSWRST